MCANSCARIISNCSGGISPKMLAGNRITGRSQPKTVGTRAICETRTENEPRMPKRLDNRNVICSIPTAVLRRIKIEPALTGVQARAVQQLGAQSITQVHIVPKSKFWEKDGMHPAMCTDGLVNMVVDEHKGDNAADVSSLTVWLRGQSVLRTDKMSEKEAVTAVVKEIERLRPAAKGQLEVAAYHSWMQDSFSRGDWAVWEPGQVTAFVKDIGRAHGRIHFCGEHTAVSNRGMEGAMESGERAALEVVQAA